ncbi:MAG: hypothetical protein WBZ29_16210 [Methanocella sp.]
MDMRLWFKYGVALLVLMTVVVTISVSGCTSGGSGSSEYVVIEEVYSEQTNATGPYNLSLLWNDATPEPMYFDQPDRYLKVNDSLKVLYFREFERGGPHRNVTSVRGVYEFPYQLDSGAVIRGMSENGTLHMSYDNKTFDLPPFDYSQSSFWNSPVVSSWTENLYGPNGPQEAVITAHWWFVNNGLYKTP